ncbi:MAG: T9SS type A sorting domain-containing protein [Bacteroidales bacterium]|nr:T9SS type A sorting domain-containing protein [Bacteroidales bacterium]
MYFKKLIFLLLTLVSCTFVQAQMTLENTYEYSTSTAYIDGEGYKFYEMDSENNMCRIYNLDHTTYQDINLDVPDDQYLYDLKYVTNHLFDQDDEIEVCYIYYEYIQEEDYSVFTTKVINADGSELVSIPGAAYATLMATTTEGDYKFVAYVYDYSVSPATVDTKVYNIPGQTNNVVSPETGQKHTQAYPNPANDKITITYNINPNAQKPLLKVYNPSGKSIMSMPLSSMKKAITFSAGHLQAGTYIYHIEVEGRRPASGKFIINQ